MYDEIVQSVRSYDVHSSPPSIVKGCGFSLHKFPEALT